MSADVINSEVFKSLINSLNTLLKFLDKIIEATNAIPVPVTAAMIALRKMAGIKFENLITLENTSNLGNAVVSKSKDISEKIKNKFTKSNQNIIETDIRIEPHTIIETDEAEKIISNATDDITEDLQSKINVIKKYFSDKANIKTNNSKGRRNAEWHASENLKNDPNGSQELLDFVRGYENVDEAVNAFVEHQKNRIKEVTANAQQAADSINILTNTIDNTDINDLQDINVDNEDSSPNEANDSIEQLVENLEEVSNASLEAEESGDELSEAIQNGMEEGSDAIQETGNNVDDLSERTEQAATGFKSLGTIASSILKNIAIAAVVTLISMAISALVEDINAWAHATENAQKDLENTAKEYEDLTSQLDDVNSKLDENAEKIAEINKNPLAFTSPDDLNNLQKQNIELQAQKQTLETIAKLKAKSLEKETVEVLTTGKFKNDKEEGIVAAATGNKNYLDATKELFKEYSDNIDNIKNKKLSSLKDIEEYQKITDEIGKQQLYLAEVVDYLSIQKEYLNEDSYLYKEINDIITNITNKTNKFEENTAIDYPRQLLANYEKLYPDFGKTVSDIQSTINTNMEKDAEGSFTLYIDDIQINDEAIKTDEISEQLNQILSNNNITIDSLDGITSYIRTDSYNDIINALKEINRLKQQGAQFDSETEKLLISQLYTWSGIKDSEETAIAFIVEEQVEAYNYFKNYLKKNKKTLSDITPEEYLDFSKTFTEKAKLNNFDTEVINQLLTGLFPDFQTIEGRMLAYIKQNPTSELSQLVNDYIKTGNVSVEVSDKLIEKFEHLGANAKGAAGYVRLLGQELIQEKIAASQAETNQAKQDFIVNKNDYDDNNATVNETYTNAISSITDGSSISYDDMWTLINADTELATKFTKSANGYKISLEDLKESQNKYIEDTKNTYLKEIDNAQKRIDDAKNQLKIAKNTLTDSNSSVGDKIEASQNIQKYNKQIEDNTRLIAQNQLMYDQASDSLFKYGEQLEKAVNKLSTFKSLYSGILNDMASIGRIGAENLVQIMQTFPEDWQKLITKSASGKGFEINKQAYKDQVVRELGFSGGDKETIYQDMFNNLETELNSLAKQYGITYDHGVSFEEQLEKVKKTAVVNGQSGFKDFSDRLDKINEGFENIDESASVAAEVIRTLFEIFKEDEALTNFNNAIDDLDYKLSTGQINQAGYDAGIKNASDKYKDAVEDPDDPNTKKQLQQNEIKIYSAQQSQYQKELDKKTQDLQDDYDRRLISAKEYYNELAKIEDKYYGTETKKGLLNDPDGTNVENKNRQQLERKKSLFNDEVSRIKDDYSKRYINFDDYKKQYENAVETWLGNVEELKEVYKEANLELKATLVNDEIEKIKTDYSRGLMTFEEFETALGNSLNYWLGNVEELKDTYDELERENISALYEEEIKLADQALERGEKTNYQYAQDMINIWKKYYKDKDRYRQEDLASERQAVEASKQAVQSQIDAFQHLIDKNNDDAEGQITELQDQKEKIERKYDKQIKTLQKQKDLISDAVDKEDRRLKILEAQKELQKTKQNSRQVYGSDGSITYKPDTEKSKEAQKNYNDAITSEILNLMQDDIDVLEKQKEEKTEPIDKKIYEIEQKRNEANKYLQAIVDMLGTILQDTYEINPEYVKRLLESDDAKAELEKINKEREQAGEKPISWADISSIIKTTKEEIDKETSQEDQENFLLNTTSETKDYRKGNGNSTDSTKASETGIDKSITKDNAKYADPLTASESRVDADKSITKDNAKSKDSKTTDNSENDKLTDNSSIESTNDVFNLDDYFNKLEKLLGTPIPVTITDKIKNNIDNANQKVQSDIEQINTNNNTGNSLTFTGDIVINSPVGDSNDLAKELMMNLPNAFQNQIYTNLQR